MASRGGSEEQVVRLSRRQMLLAYMSGPYAFGFQSIAAFLVPLRAQELGASPEMIGLIVGAGALMPALLSIPSGALADRIGPRRAYIFGTFASAVVVLFYAAMTSYWGLLGLQLLLGFARNTAWVAAQTYITGIGTAEERPAITGRFSFATNAGPFFGPLMVGGVATAVGYQSTFIFAAFLALCFTMIGVAMPEVRSRAEAGAARGPSTGFREAASLLRLRGIQVALLLTFVRLWGFAGWSPFYLVFLADRGFSPALIATVPAANGAISTAIALTAGRASRLASKEVVTAMALGLGALGIAISAHVAVVPLVYLPSLLLGISSGLSLPLLMASMSEVAPPGQRGIALGLRGQANQAASLVAPLAGGALMSSLGIAAGFGVSATMMCSVLGGAMLLHLRDRRQPMPLPQEPTAR